MANGRFRHYYWDIRSLVAEYQEEEIVSIENCSSEDRAHYSGQIRLDLRFRDGRRLVVRTTLDENDEVHEHDYYYGYKDRENTRLYSYDDRAHHPELRSHPHHLHRGPETSPREEDRAWDCDLDPISFFSVFQKVLRDYT